MENYTINNKRLTHFREYLEFINNQDIPIDILDIIKSKLHQNILENNLTYQIDSLSLRKKIKIIMKSLKMNKYYEYIPHITNILSDSHYLFMSTELQNELCESYKSILNTWCNIEGSRKSMLSYKYIIHKLLEQREKDNIYTEFISSGLHGDKLLIHDNVWYQICIMNNWTFISSFN